MAEKRMLIMPAELVKKIDENRGDMGRAEFLGFLLDSYLEPEKAEERFVTRETLQEFEQGIKELLRSFLDFSVSYGLELGHRVGPDQVEALTQRLHGLSDPKDQEPRRRAKY